MAEDVEKKWHVQETYSEPSAEAFFAEHVQPNQPLVLRGAVRTWGGLNWSTDYLQRWANEIVDVAPLEVSGPRAFTDKWLEPVSLWQPWTEPEPDFVREDKLLVVAAGRLAMGLGRFCSLLRPELSGVAATFYADGAPFCRSPLATAMSATRWCTGAARSACAALIHSSPSRTGYALP